MAEIGVPRARRDNELVVADAAVAGQDLTAGEIDAGDLAEKHGRIRLIRRMPRIGAAIFAGDNAAVAT